MNLQRREEIRELVAQFERAKCSRISTAAEDRALDAMRELLAHIDTLEQTAAERVIARGAVVKPHTFGELVNQVRDIAIQYAGTEQLRERIAYALAPHFERDAGPTPDYTGEGSAWVPPTPVTDAALVEVRSWIHAAGPVGAMVWVDPQEVLKAAGVRVLGEGMVAVTPEYLDAAWGLDDMSDLEMFMWFRDNQEESGSDAQRVAKIFWREAQDWKKHQRKKFDALRASQGGAAT